MHPEREMAKNFMTFTIKCQASRRTINSAIRKVCTPFQRIWFVGGTRAVEAPKKKAGKKAPATGIAIIWQ